MAESTALKSNIPGRAHIVLSVRDDGRLHLQAFRLGRPNASYGDSTDAVIAEIPKLLAELRQELDEIDRAKAERRSPQLWSKSL